MGLLQAQFPEGVTSIGRDRQQWSWVISYSEACRLAFNRNVRIWELVCDVTGQTNLRETRKTDIFAIPRLRILADTLESIGFWDEHEVHGKAR